MTGWPGLILISRVFKIFACDDWTCPLSRDFVFRSLVFGPDLSAGVQGQSNDNSRGKCAGQVCPRQYWKLPRARCPVGEDQGVSPQAP